MTRTRQLRDLEITILLDMIITSPTTTSIHIKIYKIIRVYMQMRGMEMETETMLSIPAQKQGLISSIMIYASE